MVRFNKLSPDWSYVSISSHLVGHLQSGGVVRGGTENPDEQMNSEVGVTGPLQGNLFDTANNINTLRTLRKDCIARGVRVRNMVERLRGTLVGRTSGLEILRLDCMATVEENYLY